jgi:hypothetical protein
MIYVNLLLKGLLASILKSNIRIKYRITMAGTKTTRTPRLKYNSDCSFDIYIQHDNPGKDKESNWLPALAAPDKFSLTMRLYLPAETMLNVTWTPTSVQRVVG